MQNKLNIPDSWAENGKTGTDWWLAFCSRKHIAVRVPEETSLARLSVFNRPDVIRFMSTLPLLWMVISFNQTIFSTATKLVAPPCSVQNVTQQSKLDPSCHEKEESLLE